MTELSQKNENNIFITKWNHLNNFVTIEGIKSYNLLESGDKAKKIKHFNVCWTFIIVITKSEHLKISNKAGFTFT